MAKKLLHRFRLITIRIPGFRLLGNIFCYKSSYPNFAPGEMAEWSIAAVLKTVEGQTSGGSNPSLSAFLFHNHLITIYIFWPT
jgi:hypothetical protein